MWSSRSLIQTDISNECFYNIILRFFFVRSASNNAICSFYLITIGNNSEYRLFYVKELQFLLFKKLHDLSVWNGSDQLKWHRIRDGQSGPGGTRTGTKCFFSPGPGPKMAGPAHVYVEYFLIHYLYTYSFISTGIVTFSQAQLFINHTIVRSCFGHVLF